jgi:tRNA-binding protein
MDAVQVFALLDLRVGRVTRVEAYDKARKPAYELWIDFGPQGTKTSSARLTVRYSAAELLGRQAVATANPGTRTVARFASDVLGPEREVPLGGRVY